MIGMKTILASFIVVMVLSGAILGAADSTPPAAAGMTTLEAVSLAEACKLVALMNEDQWDDVEKAFGTKVGMISLLRLHAKTKDWPGIGAYRGSSIDKDSPREVTHRFGFVPRNNPHGILLTYTLTESGISKPRLMLMGW
jgi:hypothetical protein